jgi:hypothetical protein
MSVNDQAAPAGDAPVTATMNEPLSVEAAAGIMAGWDDEPDEGSEAPATPEPEEAEPDYIETAAAESDEPEGEADEGEEPEQGEPEPEGYDWDKVPGNAKFRTRDGKVITAAELKQNFDKLQQLSQAEQRLSQEYAQFQQQQSQLAQQARQFEQLAPQAIAAIQQSLPQIPERPNPALANTDPIRYVEERAQYDAAVHEYQSKVAQIQQIQRVGQEQQQRLAHEQQHKVSQYVEGQRQQLLEALPVLRDEGKRKEFYGEFLSFGKKLGFSEQELNGVFDARLMVAMSKAMAHDKLMSKGKPTPSPVPRDAARTPVASPGRRVAAAETQGAKRAQLIDRARVNGGSLRDIAAIVAEMD